MAADERLQQLRRACDHGVLEAQGRLLRERMRAGELTEEQVRLAAYCGDPLGNALLGPRAPNVPLDVEERLEGLADWGRSACVRAGVGIARSGLPSFERDQNDPGPVRELIEACEQWLCAPSVFAAMEAARTGAELGKRWLMTRYSLAWVPAAAASAASSTLHEPGFPYLWFAGDDPPSADIWQSVVDELVPWALGLSDPVAGRMADGTVDR